MFDPSGAKHIFKTKTYSMKQARHLKFSLDAISKSLYGKHLQLKEKHGINIAAIFVQACSIGTLILAGFLLFELSEIYSKIFEQRASTSWGSSIVYVTTFLLIFQLTFFAIIFYFFNKYKPVKSVSDEELPLVTVIVPAYNEGSLVWRTLHSIAASDYPVRKMQLIAIDDGSKDDTWAWIQKAKAELGDRVEIYQQPENKGKRHALYRGFNMGTGEVFVTIDSDSIIEKDTLRNLVSPFVTNEECGAVAGNVKVLNNSTALIPRMLSVSFAYSFEFIRSAQSHLGSVLCTPGALAAYRREAVMNCLPEWINQTFMGKLTDIGEDRAMTNMILKQGYHVLFQKNANVYTNLPEKFQNLYKMFIRWERSNVRENIMMSKFAFSNFRKGPKAGARLLLINQWLRVIFAYPFIISMIVFMITNPVLYVSTKICGLIIFSSIPSFYYAYNHSKLESVWAYTYSIFYAFSLFWIIPYAIATANRRGWLTRG
jgi:hyaluronan synthase